MATGGFLQRLVDEGSRPLAAAVRPLEPTRAADQHSAATAQDAARAHSGSPAEAAAVPTGVVREPPLLPGLKPPGPMRPTEPAALAVGRPDPAGPAPAVDLRPPGPQRPRAQTPEAAASSTGTTGKQLAGSPSPGAQAPGPQPAARGEAPVGDGPAGFRPAVPLRDAGIRSVTRLGRDPGLTPLAPPEAGEAARGPTPAPAAPPAPGEGGEPAPEQPQDRWRDLGRRLLAAHPPAASTGPPPSRPAAVPDAGPPDTAPQAGSAYPPALPTGLPADAAADQPPELLIEHLEVRLTAPAPSGVAGPAVPAAPRPAWDAAVRRYLGRL